MAALEAGRALRIALLAGVCGGALAACGSRSALEIPHGAPVTGGGGSAATGGVGGAGASGGVAGAPCNGPVLVAPVVTVSEEDEEHAGIGLELVPASDDGELVGLALRRAQWTSPEPTIYLRHGGIRPWTEWPADGTFDADSESFATSYMKGPFFLAESPGDAMAALVPSETGTDLGLHLNPLASGVTSVPLLDGMQPVFLANNGSTWLAGTQGPNLDLSVTRVQEMGDTLVYTTQQIACAASGNLASAARFGDGFLVAAVNAKENAPGTCEHPEDASPGTRLDVSLIHPEGPPDTFLTVDWPIPYNLVRVAPHPDGAWIVFQAFSGDDRRVWAMRTEAPNGSLLGPIQVSGSQVATFEVAIAALGRSLVVVWRRSDEVEPPGMELRVIDEHGAETASLALPELAGFAGPQAMVASEARGSVVMALQSTSPTLVRAHFARVDCLGPQAP